MKINLLFFLAALLIAVMPTAVVADYDAQKEKLFLDFKKEVVQAKNESGVSLDISATEDVCYGGTTTITDCRRSIRAAKKQLDEAVKNAEAEAGEGNNTIIVNNPGVRPRVRPPVARPLPVKRPR